MFFGLNAVVGLLNLHLHGGIRLDDLVDQLNHFCTVYMCIVAAAVIGIKEFGAAAPLDCWYVDISSSSCRFVFKHYVEHVNQYCWSHHIYKFPDHPSNISDVPHSLMTPTMTVQHLTER